MKKTTIFMAALLASAVMVTVAQAETCMRLSPFVDILRLSVFIDEGATGTAHHVVFGNWITSSYTQPIVGARELNRGSTSVRRLGVHGTNNTLLFGGNRICAIDGIVGAAWTLTCVGGPGARFVNQGSPLATISCSGLAPSTAQDAGAEAGN